MTSRTAAACLLALGISVLATASPSAGNRFAYLDENDPFYPGLHFPKLITPQWVGEQEVDAVVILAVDDMAETKRYEQFLRPILNRLKKIDGRAPVSIMTLSASAQDEQVQKWLEEGLTIEVHTTKHPCPLLAGGDFDGAAATYHQCVDLLSAIPGNKPVAFRMPCCDSMDSASPRFYTEIFNARSPGGNFLTIDSSVVHRFTANDTGLPAEPVTKGGFTKYFPATTNATTRVGLRAFATTIEDYPYPYVIGKLCWEFPCAAPTDWEAFNAQGATNDQTVADWEAALDATIAKRGLMTMVFHPHGWIRSDQMVALIDYAAGKYGSRIKFLNFREAQQRLNQNLLAGEPLRAADGSDNGVRLLDLNGDGFLDVLIENERVHKTRIWRAEKKEWSENSKLQTPNSREAPSSKSQTASSSRPSPLKEEMGNASFKEAGVHFGVLGNEPVMFYRNEQGEGAWKFSGGRWQAETNFFSGLNLDGEPILTSERGRDRGARMRDLNNDGTSETWLEMKSRMPCLNGRQRRMPGRSWITVCRPELPS